MLFDRATRSFSAIAALALAPYALLAIVGCWLLAVVGIRIADHGLGFLTADRGDLRAAMGVLAVIATGTVLAVRAFAQQYRATERLERRVSALRVEPTAALIEGAARSRLDAHRIDLLEADEPFSFAYGLLRPRIAISCGLVEATTPEQLDAVLVHEHYHVRNLDPLKVVIARVLSAAFFFLPALRSLQDRYGTSSELAADRSALAAHGRAPLAGALSAVVKGPAWGELSTAAALGGPETLEVRITQLEMGSEPPPAPLARGAVVLTALTLLTFAGVLFGTLVTLGGPEAMMRNAMGARSSDMGMDGGRWFAMALPLLLVLLTLVGVGAWLLWRMRHSHTGD